MNHVDETRYLLTERGMRFLAARAGVPAATFRRHGGVTFSSKDHPRHGRVVRHREHTVGVNRFFARLAGEARAAGWQLAEWRNEAESTHRFATKDGRTAWIRPDSSGVLERGGESHPFLLEYDRGTLDAGDYRAKLEGYRRYYAAEEWQGDFSCEPVLLFVCSDDRAEDRVRGVADETAMQATVLTTAEWRFAGRTGRANGTFGEIWLPIHASDEARQGWPAVWAHVSRRRRQAEAW